jgi:hypothetical protein
MGDDPTIRAKMQLKQQSIIGTGAFDDVGRPVGVYWNADHTLLAVAGAFAGEQWHGRFFGHRHKLRWRVSIYEMATLTRIAVLDRLWSPINDITFHPHLPLLSIGAGSYDGGYTYGGALVLWDWQTGISASLLDESREVVTCRFDAADEALHLTLRPPVDEDFYDAERKVNLDHGEERALRPGPRQSMFIDLRLPAEGWRPLREKSVDVDQLPQKFVRTTTPMTRYVRQDREQVQVSLTEIAADAGQHYTARWDLWDLAWTLDNRILATRNATAVECWTLGGELVQHLPADMDGVQLLLSPGGDVAYANLFGGRVRRSGQQASHVAVTRVERIDLRSWERTTITALDNPVVLSISAASAVLARDAEREWHRRDEQTHDRVIAPDLTLSPLLDLGGFSAPSHYLRIDGAPHLYFLQGTPPRTDWSRRWEARAVNDKWVCRLDPRIRQIERLFPLEWDQARGAHLLGVCGTYIRDKQGEALILSAHVHYSQVSQPLEEIVVRRRLPDGLAMWAVPLASQVTALLYVPERQAVVVALTDGTLAVLDALTGSMLDQQPLSVGGVASVALSLAGRGDHVTAGLVDGRIALYSLE